MPVDRLIDPATIFASLRDYTRVALAVSGGPDSLALLLLYARWRADDADAPEAIVYSLDHGLRPEAAGEVRFVLAEAARLGLPARGLRWDGAKPATGVQAAARAARYALLAEAMATDEAEALVTAHHLDDQAETVLMRLAHGSGLEGLKGMRPVSTLAGTIIHRPLLGVRREALAAVVAEAGITPVADPSNEDDHYERVRWRKLMPELAVLGLTPERLALFAERAGEASDAITDSAIAAAAVAAGAPGSDGAMQLPRDMLVGMPRAIGVEFLSRQLVRVGGGAKLHDLGAIEALHERLLLNPALKPVTLHNCIIASDGETISIRRETTPRRRGKAAATTAASP